MTVNIRNRYFEVQSPQSLKWEIKKDNNPGKPFDELVVNDKPVICFWDFRGEVIANYPHPYQVELYMNGNRVVGIDLPISIPPGSKFTLYTDRVYITTPITR